MGGGGFAVVIFNTTVCKRVTRSEAILCPVFVYSLKSIRMTTQKNAPVDR